MNGEKLKVWIPGETVRLMLIIVEILKSCDYLVLTSLFIVLIVLINLPY